MKFQWLNKQNNTDLIVFFNGWGMDENIISHLDYTNYDVLVFYDYRQFEEFDFNFNQYNTKILIAWSMGVYVCNYYYNIFKNFNSFIAVNGTQKPIDDNYGIPIAIYNLTVKNFNELSCKKFMSKISDSVDLKNYCSRSASELKQELIEIQNLKVKEYFRFNKALISLNDRIIPAKNQIKYWEEENVPYITLNDSHLIFDKYKNWSELI